MYNGGHATPRLVTAKPPPTWIIKLNAAVLRRGMKIGRQYLLTVPGRRSGQPRSTPISVVTLDQSRYIVAAFENAAWVANVRAGVSGTLTRGRREERVRLAEIPDGGREPILRAFLAQVRGGTRFFGRQSPDEIVAAADRYPVFRIEADDG